MSWIGGPEDPSAALRSVPDVSEPQDPYIAGKSIGELLDDLGRVAEPGSVRHEQIRATLQARMVQELATPKRWASVAIGAAVVSSLAAVASAVAAFT